MSKTEAALSIVRSMKNHFRAFEKAEEVLQTLANAEAVIVELGRQADKLRQEISALQEEQKQANDAFVAMKSKHQKELKALEDQVSQARVKTDEDLRKLRRSVKEEENAFQVRRKEALESFEKEKKALTEELSVLRQARDEVQEVLEDLRSKVGRL